MTAPGPAPRGEAGPTEVWIAILEFGRRDRGRPFLVDDVQALITHLGERCRSGLCQGDRYAIQFQIRAHNAHEALQWAMAYQKDAALAVGLPAATLVRVEVAAREEYERSLELDVYDAARTPATAGAPLGLLCDELYYATRRLHVASTARDLSDTIIRFVITIGGQVEPGAPRRQAGMIDIDITLGDDKARHATADALSVAGLILEQSLPALLADARLALSRFEMNQPDEKPLLPPPP